MELEKTEMGRLGDHCGMDSCVAGLVQYRLIVQPGEEVHALLEAERQYAISHYGQDLGVVAASILELGGFYAKEEMEETLLRWLHRIMGQKESFTVLLNNYGSMPGNPLYIRVQDPALFRSISADIRVLEGLLRSNGCPPVHCNSHPRLGVFSKLKAGLETVLLLDFSGRTFHAEMVVHEILLVKAIAPFHKQEIVCRLRLSPKGLRQQN